MQATSNPQDPFTAPLPPAAVSALDEVVTEKEGSSAAQEKATVKTVKTSAPTTTPGFLTRLIVNPIMRFTRITAMTMLSVASIALAGVVAALTSYIVGGEVSRNETAKQMSAKAATEVATLKETFMKPAVFKVGFSQGGVEGYGFIRNFFWRNAEKDYSVAATVKTGDNGDRTLENTSIRVTSNGETFQLKAGTTDTWMLLAPPTAPPVVDAKGANAPVTAAK